ncbi:hypothetical protein [Thermocatellispora tengchongensis]|uniref:hypothetical protein n=1 Tax=Thermocatellispora tengchongensis TaxID=1073253 RepID=UPI0036304DE8
MAQSTVNAPDGKTGATGDRLLVVYAGGTLYDGVAGTDRQIADRLTRLADVLYVDPPQPTRRFAGHALERVRPGLWRLTPAAPPGGYRPGVRRLTEVLARRAVRRAAATIGAPIGAVIVAGTIDLLGAAPPGAPALWYRTDDLVAGAGLIGLSAGPLARAEARMAARADAIAVVSPRWPTAWPGWAGSPRWCPTGATWPPTTGWTTRRGRTTCRRSWRAGRWPGSLGTSTPGSTWACWSGSRRPGTRW